jgi:hypothetical protein
MPYCTVTLRSRVVQLRHPAGGAETGGQSELEPAWASVLDDPESQATARHVAMAVSSYDILLLLADLLEGLR